MFGWVDRSWTVLHVGTDLGRFSENPRLSVVSPCFAVRTTVRPKKHITRFSTIISVSPQSRSTATVVVVSGGRPTYRRSIQPIDQLRSREIATVSGGLLSSIEELLRRINGAIGTAKYGCRHFIYLTSKGMNRLKRCRLGGGEIDGSQSRSSEVHLDVPEDVGATSITTSSSRAGTSASRDSRRRLLWA